MKVLIVNCVFNKGSTGKITYDLHTALKEQGIESILCFGRGAKIDEPNVYKTCGELYSKFNNFLSRLTGIMYGGCYFSTNKLIRIIKKEKPDIVNLHCINGYFVNIYRIITWLKYKKIKTVVSLHAEFMHTANCGHAFECEGYKKGCGNCPRFKSETKSYFIDNTAKSFKKMQKAFDGFNDNLIITSVSPWLMERAKGSLILGDKEHRVVMNGLEIDTFHPYNTSELKKQHGITDEKIIFHATPMFNDDKNYIKGGYYIIELANRLKDENVKIIVAGDYKSDMDIPGNIILLGAVKDQNLLAKYYSMADLTVIASKRETFSMICAESLCCGTAVVGFKAGGPESISIPEYSRFVEYGEMDRLEKEVRDFICREFKDISEKSALKYNKIEMFKNYFSVYKELIG